jgi:4-hydroxy-2-oxoglutarate aldolase
MYNLWMSGRIEEANDLQITSSTCEIGFAQGGINGTKWVVARLRGYSETGSHCRRPYPRFADEKKKAWILSKMSLCSHIEDGLLKR